MTGIATAAAITSAATVDHKVDFHIDVLLTHA
jgi:hypothetical protein